MAVSLLSQAPLSPAAFGQANIQAQAPAPGMNVPGAVAGVAPFGDPSASMSPAAVGTLDLGLQGSLQPLSRVPLQAGQPPNGIPASALPAAVRPAPQDAAAPAVVQGPSASDGGSRQVLEQAGRAATSGNPIDAHAGRLSPVRPEAGAADPRSSIGQTQAEGKDVLPRTSLDALKETGRKIDLKDGDRTAHLDELFEGDKRRGPAAATLSPARAERDAAASPHRPTLTASADTSKGSSAEAPQAGSISRLLARVPDAVLIDWDNTIVDERATVAEIRESLFRELGVPTPPLDEANHVWRTDRDGFYSRYFPGVAQETVNQTYYAIMERLRQEKEHSGQPLNKPLPGAIELLERLRRRGIPLAVVSNKPEAQLLSEIRALGMDGLFQYVQGHTPSRELKPSAQPIDEALRAMGIRPGNVWYVGDEIVDVEAARAAGLQGILLGTADRDAALRRFGQGLDQETVFIDNPRELLASVVDKLPSRQSDRPDSSGSAGAEVHGRGNPSSDIPAEGAAGPSLESLLRAVAAALTPKALDSLSPLDTTDIHVRIGNGDSRSRQSFPVLSIEGFGERAIEQSQTSVEIRLPATGRFEKVLDEEHYAIAVRYRGVFVTVAVPRKSVTALRADHTAMRALDELNGSRPSFEPGERVRYRDREGFMQAGLFRERVKFKSSKKYLLTAEDGAEVAVPINAVYKWTGETHPFTLSVKVDEERLGRWARFEPGPNTLLHYFLISGARLSSHPDFLVLPTARRLEALMRFLQILVRPDMAAAHGESDGGLYTFDEVLEVGIGVCRHLASLMAALLAETGYQVRLLAHVPKGSTEGHAWVEVTSNPAEGPAEKYVMDPANSILLPWSAVEELARSAASVAGRMAADWYSKEGRQEIPIPPASGKSAARA